MLNEQDAALSKKRHINEAMAHLAAMDFFGLRYCLIMDPFVQPYVYKNNYKLLIFITCWTMPMDYISW